MFIYSFFRMKDQVQVQDYFWEYNDFFNDTLTLSDGQIHEQICDKQFRSSRCTLNTLGNQIQNIVRSILPDIQDVMITTLK